jgi:hypothetical protein
MAQAGAEKLPTMTHSGSGKTFSAQEIKDRTELVLEGRFARIVTVDQLLGER